MKIYEPNPENKKSWGINLRDDMLGTVRLAAADTQTGEVLCFLIKFSDDGSVQLLRNAKQVLAANGYDPAEHGNTWDYQGSLVVTWGEEAKKWIPHKLRAGQRVNTKYYGPGTLRKPIRIETRPSWLVDCDDGIEAALFESELEAVKVGRGE